LLLSEWSGSNMLLTWYETILEASISKQRREKGDKGFGLWEIV
jgi:hypothetical protein